jgi:hypothetical protein
MGGPNPIWIFWPRRGRPVGGPPPASSASLWLFQMGLRAVARGRVCGFREAEGAMIETGADPQHMAGVRIGSIGDIPQMSLNNVPNEVVNVPIRALAEFL